MDNDGESRAHSNLAITCKDLMCMRSVLSDEQWGSAERRSIAAVGQALGSRSSFLSVCLRIENDMCLFIFEGGSNFDLQREGKKGAVLGRIK